MKLLARQKLSEYRVVFYNLALPSRQIYLTARALPGPGLLHVVSSLV